jgi:hypothetical protein
MKYLSLALITVAAFAGDFFAHWLELSEKQQDGWSYTSAACLLYCAWFFWRGRPGGPADDEERRGNDPAPRSTFERTIDEIVARRLRRLGDHQAPRPNRTPDQPHH